MGNYVDSVIGKDEQVLVKCKISMVAYWGWWLFGGLFLLVGVINTLTALFTHEYPLGMGLIPLILGGLLLLPPIIAKFTTELVITNRRIIAKFGLISRSTIELNLSKIESIRVEQSLLGRLLNYGDILVVGTGGSKEPIPKISRPLEFRRRYDEILTDHDAKKA